MNLNEHIDTLGKELMEMVAHDAPGMQSIRVENPDIASKVERIFGHQGVTADNDIINIPSDAWDEVTTLLSGYVLKYDNINEESGNRDETFPREVDQSPDAYIKVDNVNIAYNLERMFYDEGVSYQDVYIRIPNKQVYDIIIDILITQNVAYIDVGPTGRNDDGTMEFTEAWDDPETVTIPDPEEVTAYDLGTPEADALGRKPTPHSSWKDSPKPSKVGDATWLGDLDITAQAGGEDDLDTMKKLSGIEPQPKPQPAQDDGTYWKDGEGKYVRDSEGNRIKARTNFDNNDSWNF
jgi:hypothetical protein